MEEIKLQQIGEELVNCPEICVYDGESVKLSIKSVDFEYSKVIGYVNNVYIGEIKGQVGVHSSRLINGSNKLDFEFYDANNNKIRRMTTLVYKRPSVRGTNSIEEEFTLIHKKLLKIELDLQEVLDWKQEIDLERSGY